MDMDRRQVFRALSAGFAALSIPGWFAACSSRDAGSRPSAQRADLRTAAAKGRPILLLHVEDDVGRSNDLAGLVGTFLMHADDDQLAPLAGVEIGCATTSEIAELAPHLAQRTDVRAILVAPDQSARCAVSGVPPHTEQFGWDPDGDVRHEASIRARHAWLARELESGIGSDPTTLERRAADERAAVGVSPAGATPSADFVQYWPNMARLRADREVDQRAAWIAVLATAVRARWQVQAPAGSTWARAGGCGVHYETPLGNDNVPGVACGMGRVPEISARFLHFYTALELRG